MISTLYQGSVKDLLGPVQVSGIGPAPVDALIFRYSDAYSVFDWGRMPDALKHKGEALAVMAAAIFEKLARPESWIEFSGTPEAMELRKGIAVLHVATNTQRKPGEGPSTDSLRSNFNDIGEKLQRQGLKTHYLGGIADEVVEKAGTGAGAGFQMLPLGALKGAVRHVGVRRVSVVKPSVRPVMGREVLDYDETRRAPRPALVPLEVVFRFGIPEGSSLIDRAKKNPAYLDTLVLPKELASEGAAGIRGGMQWGFPLIELFTKLESSDRPVSMTEALAISGLSAVQLQEVMLKSAWVAGFLRALFRKSGLELWDGKVEWAVDADGSVFLVDAVGPDELRLLKDGVQLSKEFLRDHYRTTNWYESVKSAKREAEAKGVSDWKRLVPEAPPQLPALKRELASQLYIALANEVTGRKWFPNAWAVDQVVEGLKKEKLQAAEQAKLFSDGKTGDADQAGEGARQ